MAIAVIMPRQGQSVESCIITSWNKKVGDTVEKGEILFSYETDKSSFDEAAPESGKLLAIFHEEGDDVPCLENVCVIGNDGEDFSQFAPQGESAAEEPVAKAEEKAEVKAEVVVEAPVSVAASGAISPRAEALAKKTGADLLKATPTGPNGRIIERDVQSLVDRGLTISAAASGEYTAAVEGSGINGKVVLQDLNAGNAPVISDSKACETAAAEYEEVKMPNIRKIIAKQMCASLTNMAQLTLNTSFDATKIMELRKSLKVNGEKLGLPNITLNDIVLYAVSRVILNHKGANAHCLDDSIRYFNTVNLGIAVDSPKGLLVPTLHHAEKLSLSELSRQAKGIISAAQGGSISPDLLKGGTFTVTNLGAMGIESFTPIINPPQTAILGVDCITRRLKEVDGNDVSYPAMGLSLTFDHRVLDGADAARFLKELVLKLENFDLLLLV